MYEEINIENAIEKCSENFKEIKKEKQPVTNPLLKKLCFFSRRKNDKFSLLDSFFK